MLAMQLLHRPQDVHRPSFRLHLTCGHCAKRQVTFLSPVLQGKCAGWVDMRSARAYLAREAMPTYEYACTSCGERWEEVQRITEPPTTECPKCHKLAAQRQISAGNFILKGGGWYADAYSSAKPAATKPESSTDAKTDAKADKPAETKKESTPAPAASPATTTTPTKT